MPAEGECTPVEDQDSDSDAASSSAANAKVDVHVDGDQNDCPCPPPTFDPAVSNNLIAMLITQAQQELALNMATSRSLVANAGAALTVSVQQIAAATTIQMFKMSPAEAAALGLVLPNQPPTP